MNDRYDVVIIGGGITGLIAAYELVKKGKSVAIFEKTNQLGGVIAPFKVKDYSLEGFYHHLFTNDSFIFKLAKELGLKITWHTAKIAFCYSSSEIYSFSAPLDILRFYKFSFKEKVRLCGFLIGVMLSRRIRHLADLNAKEWLVSGVGERIYDVFFKPMLRAKFGIHAEDIGADWMLSRLKIRSGRTLNGEKLGYIRGGFGKLIAELGGKVEKLGGKIYLNRGIDKIIIEKNRVKGLILEDKKEFYTDKILSTVSLEDLLDLADFPGDYGRKIRELRYRGSICVVLGMKKRLTDYYWINLMNGGLKFDALIEHTNFQCAENYGEHIIYMASYPDKGSLIWDSNDKDVIKKYLESLKNLFPEFEDGNINWAKVFRSRTADIVYYTGIKRKLPDIETPVGNLFIGGMFNAYPQRSLNMCAEIAHKCVAKLTG